jgi:MFS family permease
VPTHSLERAYAGLTLIDSVGTGALLPITVLFLVSYRHLDFGGVGLALSAGGLAAVLIAVPAGAAGDRWGHVNMVVWSFGVRAVLLPAYFVVNDAASFTVVAVLQSALSTASAVNVRAILSSRIDRPRRTLVSAYNRAVYNVGFALGAGIAAAAVLVDTYWAMAAVVWFDALSFAGAGLIAARFLGPRNADAPTVAVGETQEPVAKWQVSTADRLRVLAASLLCGLLNLEKPLLTVAFPAWVATSTTAPDWMGPALLMVSSAYVVLCQVRLSRGTEGITGAIRVSLHSALWLTAACALAIAAMSTGPVFASILLLAMVMSMTTGEILSAAGNWSLSYALAPHAGQGAFFGVWGMSRQIASAFGPVVVLALVAAGPEGWAAMGVIFLLAGLALPRPVRGIRSRAEEASETGPGPSPELS